MTTTTKSRTLRAVVAGALAVGLGVLAAGPAAAAGSYTLYAGTDYAKATTSTWSGTQGRSYAKHGALSAQSAWTTTSSSAKADAGNSSTSIARAEFR
ncbi:hypothetical protein [Cellulomonas hominis]|uniref:hypothetical protein n=1 Tax=Cellulomonas hominis TaxID=156981 RepID=UPI001B92DBA8|nr:hypothetical protein [Cellulomonas hominis]VTR75867.1 hypothetical protein CHMI_00620 [Cellulomonas hominis]